jgi:hypothetical protein
VHSIFESVHAPSSKPYVDMGAKHEAGERDLCIKLHNPKGYIEAFLFIPFTARHFTASLPWRPEGVFSSAQTPTTLRLLPLPCRKAAHPSLLLYLQVGRGRGFLGVQRCVMPLSVGFINALCVSCAPCIT